MPSLSKTAVAVLLSSRSSPFPPIRRLFSSTATMSHSKYEYVRGYELDDRLLPNSWIVVRVDGKGFHKFSDAHSFAKPNDKRALDLMNACARDVVGEFVDLVFAYGQSDEYSFVFRRETDLYRRRSAKVCLVLQLESQNLPQILFMKLDPAFDQHRQSLLIELRVSVARVLPGTKPPARPHLRRPGRPLPLRAQHPRLPQLAPGRLPHQ